MFGRSLCSALLLALASSATAGSFTYRGRLLDEGLAADGRYDLQFVLYADSEGRHRLAGPIEVRDVAVADGQFAAAIELPELVASTAYLDVAVKSRGESTYWPLAEKDAVALKAAACPASWELDGNAGTVPFQDFLGTTDNQPVTLRSYNQVIGQLQAVEVDVENYSANVRFGVATNGFKALLQGGTIAGGGLSTGPNRVHDSFGTVGGGYSNSAGTDNATLTDGDGATVSGGTDNQARGSKSAIAGGNANVASGAASTIGGGTFNTAAGSVSSIGGGAFNYSAGGGAVVAGGHANTAAGDDSFVAGGIGNCAGATGSWAGGSSAKIRPSSAVGTTGEGCIGVATTATGDVGTFVWADGQATDFVSSGSDQYLVRARGGVGVNAPPIVDAVELSIAADADDSDFANIFLRQRSNNAGLLLSAGGATSTANNDAALHIDHFNGTAQTRRLSIEGDGDLVITANAFKPGGGAWAVSSDARLKRDVRPLDGALDRLLLLQGVTFEYRRPDPAKRPAGRHDGFVAQQVAEVFPAWVERDDEGYLTVAPQGFEALTVEALRELQIEMQALLAEHRATLRELAALKAELEQVRSDRTGSRSEGR